MSETQTAPVAEDKPQTNNTSSSTPPPATVAAVVVPPVPPVVPAQPAQAPAEVTQETIADPNEVVSRRIEAYGRFEGKDSCGTCVSFSKFIPEDFSKRDEKIPVKFEHFSIDSPEGEKLAKEKNLEFIPYVKDCTIDKKGEEKCRELNEFNRKDWKKPSTKIDG